MVRPIRSLPTSYVTPMYALRGFPCGMLHLGLGYFRAEGWDDQDRVLVSYDHEDQCYEVERLIS